MPGAQTKYDKIGEQFDQLKTMLDDIARDLKEDIQGIKGDIEAVKLDVQAKSEYVESKLSEVIDGVKNQLIESVNKVGGRIEEVNQGLTRDIASLKNSTTDDINKLRASTKFVSDDVKAYKDTTDARIAALEESNRSLLVRLDGAYEAFNANANRLHVVETKLSSLERSSHGGLQHTRGWNIEVDGIPEVIGDERKDLKSAVITLLNGIGVDIGEGNIEAVHRLPSRTAPKPVIVRFYSREFVHEIHEKKKKLKDLSALGIELNGLDANSKIYIRASQCPYHKNLSYNCRLLRRAELISQVIVGKDGKTTIKTLDNKFIKIMHALDLKSNFPNFDGFSFPE